MSRYALAGARIFDGDRFHDHQAVIVNDENIAAIVPESTLDREITRHDLPGGILAPGFIDAQVNGGAGALFNDDPSIETVAGIAAAHRRFGTTGLLPTVITDEPAVMRAAGTAVAEAHRRNIPGILGIHFEGPFLDPKRRGAHLERFIRPITDDDIDYLTHLVCGTILATVSPSNVGAQTIAALASAGVIVSLGHSDATAAEALAALAAGARGFTHLFNAMSQLGVRAPGMVGAGLTDPTSYCGMIADGHHVDPIAFKVALAVKPRGKLFLVTDAMPTAAGGPSSFTLQGREIRLNNGRLELAADTLAGSNLTMDEAVRYCCSRLGVTREEALRMASLYPAAFLKLDTRLGRLAPGYRADLVHLTDELDVTDTWIGGNRAKAA